MARTKSSHDIAPMIRGAFIRAAKGLEDDGKPLSSVIRKCLEDNPLATLQAISKFIPREANITGTVAHDHKHTHEQLSETSTWIEQTILGIEASKAEESSQDRPLFLDQVPIKPSRH